MKRESDSLAINNRIKSIDFFRGVTMFMLAGEASSLFSYLRESNNGFLYFLGDQLEHHEWHGLHFWDLIQPFFMFIVGVSIPFAVAKRIQKGDSQTNLLQHALKRSFLLLFFGWALYFIAAGTLVFRFQNVLAQLSVTYLLAFLMRDKTVRFQILFSILLLIFIDLAYRFFPIEGFNHPWVNFENLGAWVNNKIEGVEKASTWASLNVVSTSAHTIWGVLCGKLLMSDTNAKDKIKKLLIAGIFCLFLGYTLDLLEITPIIKKIATVSFVWVSGGWAIIGLAICYYLIDVKRMLNKIDWFFIIVGANSIFIYLFFSVGGTSLLSKISKPFVQLFFNWTGTWYVNTFTALAVWAAMWYLCYWLYNKKIFFKL